MRTEKPVKNIITTLTLTAALIACSPEDAIAGLAGEAPGFVDPIPSPTWTPSLPEPDDPIADCDLQAPICQVGIGLQELGGDTFLGLDLQLRPPGAGPDSWQELGLDLEVAITRAGEQVERVEVQDHAIAVAGWGGEIQITRGDGTPAAGISSSEQGTIFTHPQGPAAASVAVTGEGQLEILIGSQGGTTLSMSATIDGLLLADPRPSPVFLLIPFPSDSGREGGLEEGPEPPGIILYDAGGTALASIDMQNLTVLLLDQDGKSVGLIDPRDDPVVIRDAEGSPVAAIDPKDQGLTIRDAQGNPVAAVDPKDNGLTIRVAQGNPVAAIDPKDTGLTISDSQGNPLVEVTPTAITEVFGGEGDEPGGQGGISIIYLDPQGEPTAGLGLVDGLVVIASPGVGPLALIDPRVDPAATVDPKDTGVRMTLLFPVPDFNGRMVDLAGSVGLFSRNSPGETQDHGRTVVNLKGVTAQQPEPKGTPAAAKATPTAESLRATATSAPKDPTATSTTAAPKPTATSATKEQTATSAPKEPTTKPTDEPKPTQTPSK